MFGTAVWNIIMIHDNYILLLETQTQQDKLLTKISKHNVSKYLKDGIFLQWQISAKNKGM